MRHSILILLHLPEMGISAMQELGNILSGSYLSALSDFTGLKIYPTVPSLSVDMVGAIVSFGLIEVSHYSDEVIVIDTQIREEGDEWSFKCQWSLFLASRSFFLYNNFSFVRCDVRW